MKRIFLFVFLNIFILRVFATDGDKVDIRQWLNRMFEHLDKSKIPHGLLRDYALEMADLDIYNGKEINDSNYVNQTAFENILKTIASSAVINKPFDTEDILSKQKRLHQPNCGIIGIVMYEYSYIKANALTDKLIRYENEQVYDNIVNGSWKNPYGTGYTLGFSAQDTVLVGSVINYVFSNDIWKTNLTPKRIYFDTGDGNGYRLISKGQTLQANYHSQGIKHLKLKVEIDDNKCLYAHSLIKIVFDNASRSRAKDYQPDLIEEIVATESYGGIKAKGRLTYHFSAKNKGKLCKPFIIMEGFDPLELAPEQNIYNIDKSYGNTNYYTFTDRWNEIESYRPKLYEDYDIIYIDMLDSKLNIKANIKMFERAIEIINERKKKDGCQERNIIFAQSMGGLIARCGLKEMENNKKTHETSLLFCHDTPHQGAHIPLGILQGVNGLLKFYHEKLLGRLFLKGAIPTLAPVLYCDATKQMLINYVNGNGNLDNSVHNAWQKELERIGYPKGDEGYQMRIVGISNGQTVPIDTKSPYLYLEGRLSGTSITNFFVSFAPVVSFAVGGVFGKLTNDWRVFVLNLLPGSNTYTLHFESNPPYKDLICDFNIRYTKKFLWLVPIRRTIYSYKSYFPKNMIPYDNMPGSYYKSPELNFNYQLPAWAKLFVEYGIQHHNQERIMFIPSVSALDVGEGKVKLERKDYEKIYRMDFPPEYPKHIPFDAYYITNKSTYHISLESSMINWIYQQMETTIDGPNIAVSGSKYTIRNSQYNTILWKSSDENVATIDNSGTLRMVKHGITTISAICTKNNVITKYYKKIMVGFPSVILNWHLDEGYKITAQCIEEAAKPFFKYLQYEWASKESKSSEPLKWEIGDQTLLDSRSSSDSKTKRKTFYLRLRTAEGAKSTPVFTTIDVTVPYIIDDVYTALGDPVMVKIRFKRETDKYWFTLRPNPNFYDKQLLTTDKRFQICSMYIYDKYLSGNFESIHFEKPIQGNKTWYLHEIWPNFYEYYDRVMKSTYQQPEQFTKWIIFRNSEGEIVYRMFVHIFK